MCIRLHLRSGVIVMGKTERDLLRGIYALPSFPVVLVTAGQNIMTAADSFISTLSNYLPLW